MNNFDNCPNCFMPLSGRTVCPSCGYDQGSAKSYPGVLPLFTLLNDRYLLGRVLGKGGFGVTYIAKDILGNRICAVKEYMPAEYSSRSSGTLSILPLDDDKSRFVFNHGRDKFVEEAQTLLKLRSNPVVVDILDYFTQNNTAYLVMEYLDGMDLRKRSRANGGKIEVEFAKMVFLTVASALMEIHKLNILHRDLSPENIIVTKDGRIKLIDFGAARNFVSTQNKGMSILLKPGFAPPEQYNSKGCQGPWSDIYALCATFYTLVSGRQLVDALFRYRGEKQPSLYSLGCPVSKKTSDVIEKGMELDYKQRYRDFKELLDDIDFEEFIHSGDKSSNTAQSTQDSQNKGSGFQTVLISQPAAGRTAEPPRIIKKDPTVSALVGNTVCNQMSIGTNEYLKIGRSENSCQYIVSGDTNISRIHCYLHYDGQKLYLCDRSSNGTFFENGSRLVKNQEYEVSAGTRFYLATRNHMFVVNE